MPFCSQWLALAVMAVLLLQIAYRIFKEIRLRRLMPPGPIGVPLLGNIFQIPKQQWHRLTEWKEQYGPIFSLNLAGQPVVVLNDFTTTADLLDRRSSIYSDRPRYVMARDVLTRDLSMPFAEYGDRWRRMWRGAHEGFSQHACDAYHGLLENRAALLMSHLMQDSTTWDAHFHRYTASTVLGVVYSWPAIDSSSDLIVQRINLFLAQITQAMLPGAYFVEYFPAMLSLPPWMAKWKCEGERWFKVGNEMFMEFYKDVEELWRDGRVEPCFTTTLLEAETKLQLSTQEATWLAGAMFSGGVATAAAVLSIFVLSMVLHPEAQRRAQAEIDSIVGRERLPTFADRPHLPYVNALIKEILRWRPVAPLGFPRRSTQDDWYNGYFIPKGTTVLYNVWAMNRDPNYFPDYDEFRPDRYLDSAGQVTDVVPDTHHWGHMTFGSGRRMCPGKDLADRTLFIAIASLLWTFNIEKSTGTDGLPITPSSTDFVDDGAVVRPRLVPCKITPRSPEVSSIVATHVEDAQQN